MDEQTTDVVEEQVVEQESQECPEECSCNDLVLAALSDLNERIERVERSLRLV